MTVRMKESRVLSILARAQRASKVVTREFSGLGMICDCWAEDIVDQVAIDPEVYFLMFWVGPAVNVVEVTRRVTSNPNQKKYLLDLKASQEQMEAAMRQQAAEFMAERKSRKV